MHRKRCVAVLLALMALAGLAGAQSLPQPLAKSLDKLPADARQTLQRRAATLQAMSPAQRAAFERKLADWKALAPGERGARREHWQSWRQLPAGEHAQLREAANAFAGLPVQEQLALRARYAALDDTQRRGWLLGPALGADWARLQPLLMQVEPQQRIPLIHALRAMSAQQREDLGVLAQRTPPQQRERLRRELLALAPAQRGAWLVQQLDR